MIIFDQQNYTGELGTGHGATIHDFGCALCSIAMALANSGKQTDPNDLNQKIINVNGYDSNGAGANDEIVWGCINQIYSDISLAFNNMYSGPADMNLIDVQLSKQVPVIVGVSFEHNPNATEPDHYVLLYKKNSDGTYQMLDPWFGDDTNFNARYVVNGIASAAQAICQAVSYNGITISQGVYVDAKTFENLVTKSTEDDAFHAAGFNSPADVTTKINSLQGTIDNLNGITKDKDSQISGLNTKVSSLESQVKDLQTSLDSKTPIAEQLPQCQVELEQANIDNKGLRLQIDSLNKQISGLSGTSYKKVSNQILVNELINRVLKKVGLA